MLKEAVSAITSHYFCEHVAAKKQAHAFINGHQHSVVAGATILLVKEQLRKRARTIAKGNFHFI